MFNKIKQILGFGGARHKHSAGNPFPPPDLAIMGIAAVAVVKMSDKDTADRLKELVMEISKGRGSQLGRDMYAIAVRQAYILRIANLLKDKHDGYEDEVAIASVLLDHAQLTVNKIPQERLDEIYRANPYMEAMVTGADAFVALAKAEKKETR